MTTRAAPHLPICDSVVKSFDHIGIIGTVTVDDGLAARTSLSLDDRIPPLTTLYLPSGATVLPSDRALVAGKHHQISKDRA